VHTLTGLNFAIAQNSSLFVFGVANADGHDPQHVVFQERRLVFFEVVECEVPAVEVKLAYQEAPKLSFANRFSEWQRYAVFCVNAVVCLPLSCA